MAQGQALIDHDQIRRWAESRGAVPARVKGTGQRRGKGDVGMIRLDFPGFSGGESLKPIAWNEWFRQFDANNLALVVQDRTNRGTRSNFNKLVSRDSVQLQSGNGGGRRAGAARAQGGRTMARSTKSTRSGGSTRAGQGAGRGASRRGSSRSGQSSRKSSRSSQRAGQSSRGGQGGRSKSTRRRKSARSGRSTRSAKSSRGAQSGRRSQTRRSSTRRRATSSRGGAAEQRGTSSRQRAAER